MSPLFDGHAAPTREARHEPSRRGILKVQTFLPGSPTSAFTAGAISCFAAIPSTNSSSQCSQCLLIGGIVCASFCSAAARFF